MSATSIIYIYMSVNPLISLCCRTYFPSILLLAILISPLQDAHKVNNIVKVFIEHPEFLETLHTQKSEESDGVDDTKEDVKKDE